jgi:hypothetical protein
MKKIAIVAAIIGLCVFAAPGFALDEMALQDNMTQVPRTKRISERFGRSLSNIFFSPLEVPAQMYIRSKYQQDKSDNPFMVAGGLAEGIAMGALVYFPWRLYAGLVDFFSLWAPETDPCLIEPEYLSFSTESLEKSKLPLDRDPQAGRN